MGFQARREGEIRKSHLCCDFCARDNRGKRPVATNAQSEDVNMNYTVEGSLLDVHCSSGALVQRRLYRGAAEEWMATWCQLAIMQKSRLQITVCV